MRNLNWIGAMRWTRERAALVALICLVAGIVGGWFIHDLSAPRAVDSARTAVQSAPLRPTPASSSNQAEESANTQAAPLLNQLRVDSDNLELLTRLGNLYYDSQQYATAVGFYQRALKLKPGDAAVRTDLGTAYWYLGNADAAITEFDTALSFLPNNPNTLFNRGLVKWQGKNDAVGAVADWKKLLATDPNYPGKQDVEKMLAEVTRH